MDAHIELTTSQIEDYIEDLERFLGTLCSAIVAAANVEHRTPQGGAPEAMLNVLAYLAEDVDRRLIAMQTLLHGDHTTDTDQADGTDA